MLRKIKYLILGGIIVSIFYIPRVSAAKDITGIGLAISNVTKNELAQQVSKSSIIQSTGRTDSQIVTFSKPLTNTEIKSLEETYKLKFTAKSKKHNRYSIVPTDWSLFYNFVDNEGATSVTNNDTYAVSAQTEDWGIGYMNVPRAWNNSTPYDGSDIVVAVIDTGVQTDHPDLAANILAGGYDYWNDDADPYDDNGHGTHVSGIIAAENDSEGTVGAAFNAKILPFKACSSAGYCSSLAIADSIDAAVTAGVDVINMSFGGSANSIIQSAVNSATSAGIIVVASAGNDYSTSGCLYPAAYSNVVCVAAVDSDDSHPAFSNSGPDVDIATPGVNILSTGLGSTYVTMSGTSMAAPYYAGSAALTLDLINELCISEPTNPVCSDKRAYVQSILKFQAVRDIGAIGEDDQFGTGAIDLSKLFGVVTIAHGERPDKIRKASDYTNTFDVTNSGYSDVAVQSCSIYHTNTTRTMTVHALEIQNIVEGVDTYSLTSSDVDSSFVDFGTPIIIASGETKSFSYDFTPNVAENEVYDEIEYYVSCTYDDLGTDPDIEALVSESDVGISAMRYSQALVDVKMNVKYISYLGWYYPYQIKRHKLIRLFNIDTSRISVIDRKIADVTVWRTKPSTSWQVSDTTYYIQSDDYLPHKHKYRYVVVLEDQLTGDVLKKMYYFYTK